MPFWDLQRQLGIDMDRWLLRQSATQPYGVAGACHAFEREWVECGHGLGQTRARRECQPEYEDFMECMHRTKLVSPAGRPGTGRGGGGGGRGTAAREARAEPRGGAAILRLRSRRRPRPRWALGGRAARGISQVPSDPTVLPFSGSASLSSLVCFARLSG